MRTIRLTWITWIFFACTPKSRFETKTTPQPPHVHSNETTNIHMSQISFTAQNITHKRTAEEQWLPITFYGSYDKTQKRWLHNTKAWVLVPKEFTLTQKNRRQTVATKPQAKLKPQTLRKQTVASNPSSMARSKSQEFDAQQKGQQRVPAQTAQKITAHSSFIMTYDHKHYRKIHFQPHESMSDSEHLQSLFRSKSTSDLKAEAERNQNLLDKTQPKSMKTKIEALKNHVEYALNSSGRRTTILGHISETWDPEIQNIKQANILNDPHWTLRKNQEWLRDAIKRRDHFRIISQPRAYHPGKDLYPPVFHQELTMLMESGYLFYKGWMVHAGTFHRDPHGDYIQGDHGLRYLIKDFSYIHNTCIHPSCYTIK